MESIVKRLFEQRRSVYESVSPEDRKRIESHLKYNLGSYETGVSVSQVDLVSETPNSKSFRVSYEVSIRIPYWDYESESEYYEYENEYRERVLTLSKEGLSESLTPEQDADLIESLVTIKNTVGRVLTKYQDLEDMEECKGMIQSIVENAEKALNLISNV